MIYSLDMKKIIYMDGFDRVETESGELVLNTNELECNDPNDVKSVIDNVVVMYNEGKDIMAIDDYLLHEEKCYQDDTF